MTNKQLLQDACSELAHVENILGMQTDYINLMKHPKNISKDEVLMQYAHTYDTLENWFEVNQDLMKQLESVNNALYDVAEEMEGEADD